MNDELYKKKMREFIEKQQQQYEQNLDNEGSRGPASVEPQKYEELPEVQHNPEAERKLKEQYLKKIEEPEEEEEDFEGSYHKGYKKRLQKLKNYLSEGKNE